MTPSNDAASSSPSPLLGQASPPVLLPKTRPPSVFQSPALPTASPPYKQPNASNSSLFAPTSTPSASRSISPNGAESFRVLTSSVFAGSPAGSPAEERQKRLSFDQQKGIRDLMLQAFVPHIAIHTSADTDELTTEKGFGQGLWQLLRPFGEHIQGKVTIRDSVGASRACDDFAVRFIKLGDCLEAPLDPLKPARSTDFPKQKTTKAVLRNDLPPLGKLRALRSGGDIDTVEQVVDRHLLHAESLYSGGKIEDFPHFREELESGSATISPFYSLYLKRLLSGIPMAPHETFSHPVACVITISSRCHNPIEVLRRLYDESSSGEKRLPIWVNSEYLRYYVLVHDEEKDDISKSMILFEQMKRHFGLHCHLLRIRSSHCIPTDDDAMQLPASEWLSAAEELAEAQARETQDDVENTPLCLYESDATAIRTFIREMVTQSVVPSMERCVSTWNDQIASRRRGISGRFISLSKKWTGFGAGSRTSLTSNSNGTALGSNSNYDTVQGFYKPETPEALMRKLADYAFMLRDWRLAQSIYDLLRPDFSNDKAWKYHAATNEMTALSALVGAQTVSPKTRMETIDQMFETAMYSYLTRCSDPYGAFRCLALGMELLKLRGGSATDDATRWASRLLEAKIVGPVGDALIKERIAACYETRKGTGSGAWGSRTRKSALWNILAADQWLSLRKYVQAEVNMLKVKTLYAKLENQASLSRFGEAHSFLMDIEQELKLTAINADPDRLVLSKAKDTSDAEEESEALDFRGHRKSLMGATAPQLAALETAPLHTLSAGMAIVLSKNDDFV
ncbi:MAG: hypothetical protein M1818_001112 [Claussenomyces sp. TS43310]|nr:MAG: hypothetical protein M1818_001112 [Claussenomyces sp. TS43310]